MIPAITNNKTHIIYGVVIALILGAGYTLLSRKPKEVIKTEIITKEVAKNVIVYKDRIINRTIVTKKKDGTEITVTENITDKGTIIDKSKEQTTVTKQEVDKFLSKYTIQALYPISFSDITKPGFNVLDTQIIGGVRVFDLPVLVNIGTNVRFSQVFIGLTIEL